MKKRARGYLKGVWDEDMSRYAVEEKNDQLMMSTLYMDEREREPPHTLDKLVQESWLSRKTSKKRACRRKKRVVANKEN